MRRLAALRLGLTHEDLCSSLEDDAGIEEVTGIWRLAGSSAGNAALDIVLFHGLSLDGEQQPSAYYRTWRDPRAPAGLVNLLAGDFPSARILSVSWNSAAFERNSQGLEWRQLSNMVTTGLVNAAVGQRPVVFIGHSMGGLMIKQVIVEVQARSGGSRPAQQFLDNLRGVVFIATPHCGSNVADRLKAKGVIGSLVRTIKGKPSLLVDWLQTLANDPAFLSSDYQAALTGIQNRLPRSHEFSYALCEALPTKTKVFGVEFGDVVVSQASARSDMDNYLVLVMADHAAIACPVDGKGMYASLGPHLQRIAFSSLEAVTDEGELLKLGDRVVQLCQERGEHLDAYRTFLAAWLKALAAVKRGGLESGLSYQKIEQEVEWAVKESHQWLRQGAGCDGKQAELEKAGAAEAMAKINALLGPLSLEQSAAGFAAGRADNAALQASVTSEAATTRDEQRQATGAVIATAGQYYASLAGLATVNIGKVDAIRSTQDAHHAEAMELSKATLEGVRQLGSFSAVKFAEVLTSIASGKGEILQGIAGTATEAGQQAILGLLLEFKAGSGLKTPGAFQAKAEAAVVRHADPADGSV